VTALTSVHSRLPAAPPLAGRLAAPASATATRAGAAPRDSGRDALVLSPEARAAAERDARSAAPGGAASERPADEAQQPGELTEEEQARVRELQQRDREVRAHEQAHKAAAGDLAAGGPTFELERGPDGRSYAVGGEVPIRLREGRTPQETIQIAERARRAALAPAQPSGQDRAVAAEAASRAARARAEAAEQRAADSGGASDEAAQADAPSALGAEREAANRGAAAELYASIARPERQAPATSLLG
jgi:hypothetical protein